MAQIVTTTVKTPKLALGMLNRPPSAKKVAIRHTLNTPINPTVDALEFSGLINNPQSVHLSTSLREYWFSGKSVILADWHLGQHMMLLCERSLVAILNSAG